MLEIAHVKGNHSTLIILHVYPLCKWLQGALRLFMPGCDKNAAASGGRGSAAKGWEIKLLDGKSETWGFNVHPQSRADSAGVTMDVVVADGTVGAHERGNVLTTAGRPQPPPPSKIAFSSFVGIICRCPLCSRIRRRCYSRLRVTAVIIRCAKIFVGFRITKQEHLILRSVPAARTPPTVALSLAVIHACCQNCHLLNTAECLVVKCPVQPCP